MQWLRLCIGLTVVGALTALPSMAVNDPGAMYVRTNTANATCFSFEAEDTSVTTECEDDTVSVSGNSVRGCMSARGTGQCVFGSFPNNTNAVLHVHCPTDLWTFQITTGNGATDGHCDIVQDDQGVVTGAHCANGSGAEEHNITDVNCLSNNGEGSCAQSTGSAACVTTPSACADSDDPTGVTGCIGQCRSERSCKSCCHARLEADIDRCTILGFYTSIRCTGAVHRRLIRCLFACAGKPCPCGGGGALPV